MYNLNLDIKAALAEYKLVINRMSDEKQHNLYNMLFTLQKLGVIGFGYRIFDLEGNSALFSTSIKWNKIHQDKEFEQSLKEHMCYEVLAAKKNKQSLFTRTGDKINTSYLAKLQKAGINNSVVKYIFTKNQVEAYYFVCSSPEQRDLVLDNLFLINNLITKSKASLDFITNSKEFSLKKAKIFSKHIIDRVWSKNFTRSNHEIINFYIEDKLVPLTLREAECLAFIKWGVSNINIAQNLKVSVSTIKETISSLKDKLSVLTRKELINVIRDQNITSYLYLLETYGLKISLGDIMNTKK